MTSSLVYGDGDESPSLEAPLQRTAGQINPHAAGSLSECLLWVESGHKAIRTSRAPPNERKGVDLDRVSPELALADAHVALAMQHIARQKEIIAEFALAGHPTALAADLLAAYEQAMVLHLLHRDRIMGRLSTVGTSPA